jgi:alginate O-acetyltransferase complex protein AlgI
VVFSSSLFLYLFLPFFLLLYYIVDKKFKNYILLIASLIFYSWGEPWFIFIILASTFIDFHIVNGLYRTKIKRKKNIFLFLSISTNLGLLLYFKYANFFIENVNATLNSIGIEEVAWTSVALPIGISFYTFQTLTYSIDIYRGIHKPLEKVTDYLMYILMFPQLIAGPIVRFHEVADQIVDREKRETIDNKLLGFFRFVIGLSKKVLIANVIGAEADKIFALSEIELSTYYAWIGVLAYTFQIYFDFSGYSDMAIGLGRMIGFKFPENFDNPYVSQNITEFWRRWHMTLGRWMKDYLYIPLGGSKVDTKFRLYFNLWFVFLISGLWHGAAWNFVAWGAFHGLFLILDKMFWIKTTKIIGKYPSILITFFITLIGWVLFRSETFDQAIWFTKAMFSFNSINEINLFFDREFWTILIIAIFFAFFTLPKLGLKIQDFIFFKEEYNIKTYLLMSILILLLLLISTASITSSGFNPFIYFRF